MARQASKKPFKIGDLARTSNLSERSLRHYEDMGIIRPSRSEGGTRCYSTQDVAVAQLVQKMRDLNIPLDLISSIATSRQEFDTGAESSAAVRSYLSELSGTLMAMARQAAELQVEVTGVIMEIDKCLSCKNKPSRTGCPDCPMNDLANTSPLADMIWRGDDS